MNNQPSPVTVINGANCYEKVILPALERLKAIEANPDSTKEEIENAESDLKNARLTCIDIEGRDLKKASAVVGTNNKPNNTL